MKITTNKPGRINVSASACFANDEKGLTARSAPEALENFSAACDNAAIELQEFAKNAKKSVKK